MGGSTASTRARWTGRRRRPESTGTVGWGATWRHVWVRRRRAVQLGPVNGVDPSYGVGPTASTGGSIASTRMPGAGRPRRPEHVGRVDSTDRWVGEVDPRASTGRKPGLSGLCGSAVSSRAQWPSATAAIERSLGGGRLGGGDSEAGAGPRAAGPEQSEAVGGVGGAGTISLRRMVCRLSRFGGSDGSRHLHAWRPEASADNWNWAQKHTSY